MYALCFFVLVGSLMFAILLGTVGDELLHVWQRLVDKTINPHAEQILGELRKQRS